MSASPFPRIAVSVGDPNGVGPEIVLKVLQQGTFDGICRIVPVGPRSVYAYYSDHLGLDMPSLIVEPTPTDAEFKPFPGRIGRAAGQVAMEAVTKAIDLCLTGDVEGMVTCPISKEAISLAGHAFPGHTEFIADKTRTSDFQMIMVSGGLKVGLVSGHVPLSRGADVVDASVLRRALKVMLASLRIDFGLSSPSIAVLGLNPHAGDGGVLGKEELDWITPEIVRFRKEGNSVEGPFPADGFFGSGSWKKVDAILAMYHDQGLIPFKTLSFGEGVNFTAGLPIVRTSPDHGTAFDIAGSGRASEASLVAAIKMAVEVATFRQAQKQ